MPRPEVNLDRLRPEIEQRIIPCKQHKEVLAWLATQGVVINRKLYSVGLPNGICHVMGLQHMRQQ